MMEAMAQNKYATVLNSRQRLQPSNQLDWIKSSQKAVEWVRNNGLTLVSSVGTPNWDAVTAIGSMKRVPLKLVIPVEKLGYLSSRIQWVTSQFGLDSVTVDFIPCQSGKPERDKIVLNESDLIIPVSIRPRGLLEELVSQHRKVRKEMCDQFRVKYEPRSERLSYTLEGLDLNPALHKLETDYRVHWTRASNGPWPDEFMIDYYCDIVSSTRYPRLAIDTMRCILETNLIMAGNSNFEAGVRAISFSSAKPYELVKLVKWRARKRQMSFEPYGIGFEPELANQIGIKPVIYYNKDTGPPDNVNNRWQLQSQGTITDWRNEKELRFPSDLRLDKLDKNKMILFCLTPEEATQLSASYGIKTISFLP